MLKSVAAAIILALPLTLAAPTEQSNDVASEVPEGLKFHKVAESDDVTFEWLDDEEPSVEERTLETRAYSGDITYFYPGLGACGWNNNQNEMVVAVSHIIFSKSNPCGKKIRVKGPKGSVDVKVVDKCPSCTEGSVDLSPAAFKKAVGDLGLGRKKGSWTYI